MKYEQGWECHQLVGGCRRHEAEFFQGQLEFNLIIYNKVVVAASCHHSSPGWITQKVQIRAAKQAPISRCVTVSQEAKLINFDIVNP